MNRRGFSLIELVIVIALMVLLTTIAMMSFGTFQRKALVERNVKELYTDMQEARMRAAYTKVRQGVEFAPNQVTFMRYTSTNDPGTVINVKRLPLSITLSGWVVPTANRIDFDTRGLVTDPIIKVICFTTNEDAAYDAIIVSPVITNMGRVINKGIVCGQANVIQK